MKQYISIFEAADGIKLPIDKEQTQSPANFGSQKKPSLEREAERAGVAIGESMKDYDILNETPDNVIFIKPNGEFEHIKQQSNGGAIAFGITKSGEIAISVPGGVHAYMFSINSDWEIKEYPNLSRSSYLYAGRLWVREKVISFWHYPHPMAMEEYMEQVRKQISNMYDFFKDGFSDLYYEYPGFDIESEFDKDPDKTFDILSKYFGRIVEDIEDVLYTEEFGVYIEQLIKNGFDDYLIETNVDSEYYGSPKLAISYNDYIAEKKPQKPRTKKELATKHVQSPMKKENIPVSVGGSKKEVSLRRKAEQSGVPIGEGLRDYDILNESPDFLDFRKFSKDGTPNIEYKNIIGGKYTYDEINSDNSLYGNDNYIWNDGRAVAFGYIGKYLAIRYRGNHNNSLYVYDNGNYKNAPIRSKNRHAYIHSGRIWLDKQIISFWYYPEPSELKKIIDDIYGELWRLVNLIKSISIQYCKDIIDGESMLLKSIKADAVQIKEKVPFLEWVSSKRLDTYTIRLKILETGNDMQSFSVIREMCTEMSNSDIDNYTFNEFIDDELTMDFDSLIYNIPDIIDDLNKNRSDIKIEVPIGNKSHNSLDDNYYNRDETPTKLLTVDEYVNSNSGDIGQYSKGELNKQHVETPLNKEKKVAHMGIGSQKKKSLKREAEIAGVPIGEQKQYLPIYENSDVENIEPQIDQVQSDIPDVDDVSKETEDISHDMTETDNFKRWFGNSKVVGKDGKPLVCYHGTNNKFLQFKSPSEVGRSHDRGFYGDGYYFTFNNWNPSLSKGEASYYGNNIIDVYIKAETPFYFNTLSSYKGNETSAMYYESMVFLRNIAEQFPEIAEKIVVSKKGKYDKENDSYPLTNVSITVLPELFKKYHNLVKIEQVYDRDETSHKIAHVKSKKVSFVDVNNKTHEWISTEDLGRYNWDAPEWEIIMMAIIDAIEKYEGIEADYHPEGYMTRYPEITDAIKSKGHDAIMQSKNGDEIVVFKPNQIKSATGNNGNFDNNKLNINENKSNTVLKSYMHIFENIQIDNNYEFLGMCDRLRHESDANEQKWQEMMKYKLPISDEDFIQSVNMGAIIDDDDETPEQFISTMRRSDSEASAYKSNWGDMPSIFYQTAGFEYIFVKNSINESEVWEMDPTGEEYGNMPYDELCRSVFGFAPDDITEIDSKDLNVWWANDFENAKYHQKQSGLSPIEWAKTISLNDPIDIFYKNNKFYINDGHHRYYAASILNKKLKVNEVIIKDKPHITAVLNAKRMGKTIPDNVLTHYSKMNESETNAIPDWDEHINKIPMLKEGVAVLNKINQIAKNNGIEKPEAFIVGGAVRDLLTGEKTPDDIDIATNVPIDVLEPHFKTKNIGKNKDFGLIMAISGGFEFEIANYRTDVYSDDALEKGKGADSVRTVDSYEEDSSRRDFTVNAMAVDKDGNIVDHHGGMADIESKTIRAVGEPRKRFEEDATRLLRAIRFSNRLGFDIEENTLKEIKNSSPLIKKIVSERIMKEIKKLAKQPGHKFAQALNSLYDTGILHNIFPEIAKMKEYKHNVEHHPEGGVWDHVMAAIAANNEPDPLVNLGILLHDVGKPDAYEYDDVKRHTYNRHESIGEEMIEAMAKRLDLSNDEKEAIKFVTKKHMLIHNLPKLNTKTLISLINDPNWELLKKVAKADIMSRGELYSEDDWKKIEEIQAQVNEKFPPGHMEQVDIIKQIKNQYVGGKLVMDLLKLKRGGPIIGDIQEVVVDWMIDTEIKDQDEINKKIIETYTKLIGQEVNEKLNFNPYIPMFESSVGEIKRFDPYLNTDSSLSYDTILEHFELMYELEYKSNIIDNSTFVGNTERHGKIKHIIQSKLSHLYEEVAKTFMATFTYYLKFHSHLVVFDDSEAHSDPKKTFIELFAMYKDKNNANFPFFEFLNILEQNIKDGNMPETKHLYDWLLEDVLNYERNELGSDLDEFNSTHNKEFKDDDEAQEWLGDGYYDEFTIADNTFAGESEGSFGELLANYSEFFGERWEKVMTEIAKVIVYPHWLNNMQGTGLHSVIEMTTELMDDLKQISGYPLGKQTEIINRSINNAHVNGDMMEYYQREYAVSKDDLENLSDLDVDEWTKEMAILGFHKTKI